VDAQLVGIVGALAGVAVGGGLNWARDEWQRRGEDERRFHGDRLRLYAQFLKAAHAQRLTANVVSVALSAGSQGIQIGGPVDVAIDAYQGSLAELQELTWEVDLIGTPAVRSSVADVRDALNRLAALYGQIHSPGPHRDPNILDRLTEAEAAFSNGIERFSDAARTGLGIKLGS
jgi:hypothetical protein